MLLPDTMVGTASERFVWAVQHPGGPPGRPPARGRLRPRCSGDSLPGLREADDGNDYRVSPLAQDDPRWPRGGTASRSTRAGLCSRPSRWRTRTSAIAASTRSSLSTSLPFWQQPEAALGAVREHLARDGAVYLFWDARHLRAGASPGPRERAGRPASRGRVLRRQGAGRGPAPGPRGLRDRAAPGRMSMDRNTVSRSHASGDSRPRRSERFLFLTASTSTSPVEPLTPRQTVEDRPPWTSTGAR